MTDADRVQEEAVRVAAIAAAVAGADDEWGEFETMPTRVEKGPSRRAGASERRSAPAAHHAATGAHHAASGSHHAASDPPCPS